MIRDVAVRLMGSLLGLLGNAVWIVAVAIGFVIGWGVANVGVAIFEQSQGAAGIGGLAFKLAGGALGGWMAWVRVRAWLAPAGDVFGSARWAKPHEVRKLLGGKSGIIVGRGDDGHLLRYDGAGHLLTIAPTRSGKGVGAIIPNLLLLDRSIICVDPKGENAKIAADARRRFGPVYVLDPFEVSGHASAAFNPMDGLDVDSADASEEAALIADALVYDPPDQVGEAHWNEEARALIAGVVLHVASGAARVPRNLAALRDLLTRSPGDLRQLLSEMQRNPRANGLVARAANRHLSKADREAAGVLSAAQRHTHFLDSPRMARVTARSDFAFDHLRAGVATVFFVLPPNRLATHARWLRLMVAQALGGLSRQLPDRDAPSVLFMLDEFRALGRLEAVERAVGLMAGYGVQVWPFVQDAHQLRGAYGAEAGTFLSNSALTQVFDVADYETASWISRTLGAETRSYETSGESWTSQPDKIRDSYSQSFNDHRVRRELLTPDEVMRFSRARMILLASGMVPISVLKVRYFSDREFASWSAA